MTEVREGRATELHRQARQMSDLLVNSIRNGGTLDEQVGYGIKIHELHDMAVDATAAEEALTLTG